MYARCSYTGIAEQQKVRKQADRGDGIKQFSIHVQHPTYVRWGCILNCFMPSFVFLLFAVLLSLVFYTCYIISISAIKLKHVCETISVTVHDLRARVAPEDMNQASEDLQVTLYHILENYVHSHKANALQKKPSASLENTS